MKLRYFLLVTIILSLRSLFLSLLSKNRPNTPFNDTFISEHTVSDEDTQFLYDITYKEGRKVRVEQKIIDTIHEMMRNAKEYILLDMFLFGDRYGSNEGRRLCDETIDVIKKIMTPDSNVKIDIITDRIKGSIQKQAT